ncbi:MAG: type IX secretion system protein PorQ [Bacteroidales bacterium]|nr:type IX secretion system protein PorQ [Bacteroidales bacterium]
MKRIRAIILLVFSFYFLPSYAQLAGMTTMAVLDMPTSARTAGLGMDFISMQGGGINAGLDNPSLISPNDTRRMALNYTAMLSGGSFGSVAYALDSKRFGTFLVSLRFNSYGRFTSYDEQEHWEGTFGAADYQLGIGWGLKVDSAFSFGATFKPVLSQYESYTAFTIAFDVAATYTAAEGRLSATALARNIGTQVVTMGVEPQKIPFELTAAVSYKMLRAPFRLFAAARHLQHWQIAYEDPLEPTTIRDPFTGEINSPGVLTQVLDNIGRHIDVGAEVYIGKMFFVDLGYSYRQAREMRSIEAFNLSAFSFGIGFRAKRIEFVYARNNYHLSQAPNHISLVYKF